MFGRSKRKPIFTGGGRGSTVVNGKIYRRNQRKEDVENQELEESFRERKSEEVRAATVDLLNVNDAVVDAEILRKAEKIQKAVEEETVSVQKELKKQLGVSGEVMLDVGSLRRVTTGGGLGPMETIIEGKVKLENSDLELDVVCVDRGKEFFPRFDLVPNPHIWGLSRVKVREGETRVFDGVKKVHFSWVQRPAGWFRSAKVVRVDSPEVLERILG